MPSDEDKEGFFKKHNTPDSQISYLAKATHELTQGMVDLANDNSPPLRGRLERQRLATGARHLRTIGDAIKAIDYFPIWQMLGVNAPQLTGKGGLVTLVDRVSHRSVRTINKESQDQAIEYVLSQVRCLSVATIAELFENGLPTDVPIHAGSELDFEEDDQEIISTTNIIGMNQDGGLFATRSTEGKTEIVYCNSSELRKAHPTIEIVGTIPSTSIIMSSGIGVFLYPETYYRMESLDPEGAVLHAFGKLRDSDTEGVS